MKGMALIARDIKTGELRPEFILAASDLTPSTAQKYAEIKGLLYNYIPHEVYYENLCTNTELTQRVISFMHINPDHIGTIVLPEA